MSVSNRCRSRRRNRRGFTLVEILLVAAILVVVASMATLGYTAMQKRATSSLCRNEIKVLETACTAFKVNHQRFPDTLDNVLRAPQGMTTNDWGGPYVKSPNMSLKDPWGQEYRYSRDDAADLVMISSSGPDRQWNTEDDIRNMN
jgi:general secretion pathway protein G